MTIELDGSRAISPNLQVAGGREKKREKERKKGKKTRIRMTQEMVVEEKERVKEVSAWVKDKMK